MHRVHGQYRTAEYRAWKGMKCNATFDPFAALADIARGWLHYSTNKRCLEDEIARLERTKDALRREIANLKAQRRRLA
jgi:hypothetical protein